jgi:hypothetical protein
VPRTHGQFAKCFGGKRIGRNEERRDSRAAVRHDRDHEEPVRPLGATGDAAPQKNAPRTAVGRDTVGFQAQHRGLPALASERRERQRAEGRRGQRDANRIAASRRCDAVNRQCGDERERERGCTHSNRVPQRDAPRRVRPTSRIGSVRQANQTRLNTSVPFVPPNPKEFFSATSIFISRAVLAQ